MARSKSSQRWLDEHFKDKNVKLAQQQGYRSRAVYKLIEIQKKDKILKSGMSVVDLGAAPGSWSQYAIEKVGSSGQVVAVDCLPMDAMPNLHCIQGDFRENAILEQILATLNKGNIDLVMSDMAPNMTGIKTVDQARSIELAELALEFAEQVLDSSGRFLVKLFQGQGFETYCQQVRRSFKQVVFRKPQASRARSREVYLLAG